MARPRLLRWISRDGKLLITTQALRSFGYGFLSVLLAVYLESIGWSLARIGVFFSVGVAGSAALAFGVTLTAERVGRRRFMVGLSLVTALAACVFVATDQWTALILASAFGMLTGVGGSMTSGATAAIEQASLAETAAAPRRTDLYAVYRFTSSAALALGALAAGLPGVLVASLGATETASFRAMFALFAVCLSGSAVLFAFLSPAVEARRGSGWTNPLRLRSRRLIFTLVGLFSVDSFAGALLLQSLVAYWFQQRFGLDIRELAVVFFFSQVLTAASLWVSARLASRIGLINTMVFTHIPASLFLIAAAFAPAAWMAVALWQLRSFFSQMDVPTRDSYTMAVVAPDERVAMAGLHMLGRSGAAAAGPAVATALWAALSAAAPLVACGVLKIAYDLSLFALFRNVRPPEEAGHRKGATGVRRTSEV